MPNKENLIYSLEDSINNLKDIIDKSIKSNIANPKEVYYSLGTALLWIGICLDKLKGTKYTENEYGLVQAFIGAYNAQKHGKDIVGFAGFVSGSRFPMSFPMRFGEANYYFKELDEDIINNKKQIIKYNEFLNKKDILESISTIKEIIIEKMKIV